MKRALRLVRFYGGGVSLNELLSSGRLMRVASEVQAEEYVAAAAEEKEAIEDAIFDARAAAFLGSGS